MPFLEIYRHVKQLQPNCLMSDYNQGRYPAPALYYTDVKQYEQHAGQTIPAGSEVPSQSATTLQSDWFWKLDYPTQELRSAKQIVEEWLIPFNARHCNLILNVAPNRRDGSTRMPWTGLLKLGELWRDRAPAPRLATARRITTPNLASARPSYASSIADTSGPDLQTMIGRERTGSAIRANVGVDRDRSAEADAIRHDCSRRATYLGDYGTDSRIVSYRVEAWSGGQWREVPCRRLTQGNSMPDKADLCGACAPEPARDRRASRECRVRGLCE